MVLAGAVGTLLCAAGTVLVFIVAVAGFALIFIGFGAFAVIPFMAWGLAGPGERDIERRRLADDAGATSELTRGSPAGRHRTR